MLVDVPSFTPWASLAGGVLIGIAATVLLRFNRRIADLVERLAREASRAGKIRAPRNRIF